MSSKLFLHDHPVSSYAQKVRIALREKEVPFDRAVPEAMGSGKVNADLQSANPRNEVPALVDGDVKIFDSTIILEYLEDKFPEKPLLPKSPADRAKARMIEDVCDTTYEAVNWGYAEVVWGNRATGELGDKLQREAKEQTEMLQAWLIEQLGDREYLVGSTFGWADAAAAPIVHRSFYYGMAPAKGSALDKWHDRISQRPSVKQTFEEMEEGSKVMQTRFKSLFTPGSGNRREYRDHRLEFLVKSGGIDVVTQGIKDDTIRFTWPKPL